MINNSFIDSRTILKKLGLSENEIAIYLTGLKLGSSLASVIGKEVGLQRTLVYHLLDTLAKKGLVSVSGTEHKKLFLVEPPEKLKELIIRKKSEFEMLEQQLEQISPELESLYNKKGDHPKIKFYNGLEGIKNVANELLHVTEPEILGFIAIENLFKTFDETFIRYWSKERARRNIVSKTIWSKDIEIPFLNKLEEFRVAPEDILLKNATIIFDNKIASFSPPDELFAVIIEDAGFAQTLKTLFAYVWKRSIKVSSNIKK